MRKTSISDSSDYPMFCYFASKNDEAFKNFRRHPAYLRIVEGISPEYGRGYLQVIFNNYKFRLTQEQWDFILKNDTVGNPPMYVYESAQSKISCSAVTLRYAKVFCDIVSLFPESILRGGGVRNWHRVRWAVQNSNEHVAASKLQFD